MKFTIFVWCQCCQKFVKANTGIDPFHDDRITEILRPHRKRWGLRRCPGSGTDADPLVR